MSTEPMWLAKNLKVRQCNDVDKQELNYTPIEYKCTYLEIFRKVKDVWHLLYDKSTTIHTFRETLWHLPWMGVSTATSSVIAVKQE